MRLECQFNIWSSDTKTYMRLIITDKIKIIYSTHTERLRSPYTEHAASRLPNPTPLEGGGTIYPGSRQAKQ